MFLLISILYQINRRSQSNRQSSPKSPFSSFKSANSPTQNEINVVYHFLRFCVFLVSITFSVPVQYNVIRQQQQ